MTYTIIEHCNGWFTKNPTERVIKIFKHRWQAVLYRWWYYGWSEPIWQGSFQWEIRTRK